MQLRQTEQYLTTVIKGVFKIGCTVWCQAHALPFPSLPLSPAQAHFGNYNLMQQVAVCM